MAKLAMATGLSDEPAFNFLGNGQRLPVGNARHADLGHHVELATHPVD